MSFHTPAHKQVNPAKRPHQIIGGRASRSEYAANAAMAIQAQQRLTGLTFANAMHSTIYSTAKTPRRPAKAIAAHVYVATVAAALMLPAIVYAMGL